MEHDSDGAKRWAGERKKKGREGVGGRDEKEEKGEGNMSDRCEIRL